MSEKALLYYIHRAATNKNILVEVFSVEIITTTYNRVIFRLISQQFLQQYAYIQVILCIFVLGIVLLL
jgi:hypothetical protein